MSEEKKKYLYGAAVQGIQSFIFQTNVLKDIVGASELVEQICTKEFDEQLKTSGMGSNYEILLKAAGNIKCEFEKKADCEKVVLNFPKRVMELAPGITISQAVVEYVENSNNSFSEAIDKLESNLRAQRNKPMSSLTTGLMGVQRSRATGLPETDEVNGEFMDKSSFQKRYEISEDKTIRKRTTKTLCKTTFHNDKLRDSQIAYNIEDITDKNDWIAVIHADGNGLGQVVQKVGKDKVRFKEFSENLTKATVSAAQKAFDEVKVNFDEDQMIPIRPIVLGGDDFTVICRADFAIEYVTAFIKAFEEETEGKLGYILEEHKVFDTENKLTACAGVAFIKSSYPFYYGYELAEALCSEAKKDAKKDLKKNELPKSCLMFHKVQDSFVQDYKEIEARELTPMEGISWKFGPYYINETKENKWTVKQLLFNVGALGSDKDANAVKSHLRQWMSLMHEDKNKAKQLKDRLLVISSGKKALIDTLIPTGENVFPVYDTLALNSIKNLTTK